VFAQTIITVRTSDGLFLSGTLALSDGFSRAAVLVHGQGVTREEGGFFTRLAAGSADTGIASLRFDLHGHGESEGRQEELTLAAMCRHLRYRVARCPASVARLPGSLLIHRWTGEQSVA
jgi:predicted alpha/beta hydrolase